MRFVLLAALLALTGCATTAPQATEILKAPGTTARSAQVENVPFIEQSAGHCGPASLAMVMNWAGHQTSVDELAPKVMTSSKEGSLQEDMISATRREGLMGIRVADFRPLLSELNAKHPVIVFKNLGLSWYPRWHYAVVTGYDLERAELTMHSGPERNERVGMKIFERSWKHSDYWALVVLPAGQISLAAGELENVRAAAGLELASHLDRAETAYRAIIKNWPDSLGARIGLANVAYAKKDFRSAINTLEEASRLHPDSEIVRRNLETAKRASKTR